MKKCKILKLLPTNNKSQPNIGGQTIITPMYWDKRMSYLSRFKQMLLNLTVVSPNQRVHKHEELTFLSVNIDCPPNEYSLS
jgi:hypothetical protein